MSDIHRNNLVKFTQQDPTRKISDSQSGDDTCQENISSDSLETIKVATKLQKRKIKIQGGRAEIKTASSHSDAHYSNIFKTSKR